MSVPRLPADEVRAAIADGDFHTAAELIDIHHGELAAALAVRDTAGDPPSQWVALLLAHRGLLEELRSARDASARAIAELGNQHRGARAYLQHDAP